MHRERIEASILEQAGVQFDAKAAAPGALRVVTQRIAKRAYYERVDGRASPAVHGRRLLVLHVFVKKTQAAPRKALDTARQRLESAT